MLPHYLVTPFKHATQNLHICSYLLFWKQNWVASFMGYYLFIYLLYGLNTRYVIHCSSEGSQMQESLVSLQEGTTVQSRFKPVFKCTGGYSKIRNHTSRKTIPHCRWGVTKSTLIKVKNCCTVLYNVYTMRSHLSKSLVVMDKFWQVQQLLRRQHLERRCENDYI